MSGSMIVLTLLWKCAVAIGVWYLISESISWWLCQGVYTPEQYDSAEVKELRAGVFMLPLEIVIVAVAWLGMVVMNALHEHGIIEKPSDQLVDHIL